MNDNLLQIERDQPVAANAPASLPGTEYRLDWETTEIDLGKGRRAVLRRPRPDEVLAVDAERQTEIPIGRDGSYQLPDPTINEAVDAKAFDQVKVSVDGYPGEMPEQHKAAALNGLYRREIYVDENFQLTDEEIRVFEEIGGDVEPDYTVVHVMRPPSEGELKLYRRKSTGGEVKPGKRGRQIFKTSSNLRTAMSFYEQWLVNITGATVDGKTWADNSDKPVFVAHVDPLIQRQVANVLVEAFTAKLSD